MERVGKFCLPPQSLLAASVEATGMLHLPARRQSAVATTLVFPGIDYRIERSRPPSARRAAPLVAAERGLATNATNAATSSTVANRCRSELGATDLKKVF